MIRLLRHDDSASREEDGAVKFEDLAPIVPSSHWSIRTWLNFLQRGGGIKKRFQFCVDPNSPETFLYFQAVQGHTGGKHIESYIARQRVVAERFRRAHPSRRKLP